MASIWDAKATDTQPTQTDYPVLEPGIYEFEVVNSKLKEYFPKPTSKIGHCAQLDVRLQINDRFNVFESLFFDPNTAWKVAKFAKSIGLYHADGVGPAELDKNCVGKIGEAEIVVEEYNGRKRNRVKTFIEKKEPVVSADDLPF